MTAREWLRLLTILDRLGWPDVKADRAPIQILRLADLLPGNVFIVHLDAPPEAALLRRWAEELSVVSGRDITVVGGPGANHVSIIAGREQQAGERVPRVIPERSPSQGVPGG